MGFVNLKTKTKLLLSFFIVLVLTGVVGVNGLMNAGAVYKDMEDMYHKRLMTNLLLGKIQVNTVDAGRSMMILLWESKAMNDLNVVTSSEAAISELAEENDKLLKEYEANSLGAEEKAMLEKFKLECG